MNSVRTLPCLALISRLQSCPQLLLFIVCLATFVHAAPAAAQDYNKFIIFDGVAADANLEGGALVETWAGNKEKDDKVKFKWVERLFTRADPMRTATDNVNGATLVQIIHPVAGVKVAFGTGTTALWNPAKITADDAPAHKVHNVATSKVDVFSEAALATTRKNPLGGPPIPVGFVNAVTATLTGSVSAGLPADGDKYHSADSWAGVYVKNAKTFVKTIGAPEPFGFAGEDKVGFAGATDLSGGKPMRYLDPFFLTVNDLTTGVSTTSEIMSETITALGADVFIDDAGIHLAVNRNNPLSSVSLQFSSETPWVTDPYHYGATLDNSGLTLDGDALPLPGWTITTTADRIDALYAFGPGGAPLDMATVVPPEALFTLGHTYSYDVGGGGGAFALAVIPEPSSLALILSGLAGLSVHRFRRPR